MPRGWEMEIGWEIAVLAKRASNETAVKREKGEGNSRAGSVEGVGGGGKRGGVGRTSNIQHPTGGAGTKS